MTFLQLYYSKVHVSKQTLDMLGDNYIFELGTDAAKNDTLLQKNNIETYLISPQYLSEANVSFFLKKY